MDLPLNTGPVKKSTNKRGGSRPGSGAPKKPPGEKRIKTAISMRPDLYQFTSKNRSAIIEEALDMLISIEKACEPKQSAGEIHYAQWY